MLYTYINKTFKN